MDGTVTPAAGDWLGLSIEGTADIEHTAISYAEDAIDARGGGQVGFRGTLTHNLTDVTSCDWGTGTSCGVDVAYTNWGDGSAGPFPAPGSLICGVVTASPWLPAVGSTEIFFHDGNCNGSTTPDAALGTAEATYTIDVDNVQIQ